MSQASILPCAPLLLLCLGALTACGDTSAPRAPSAGTRMGAGPTLLQEVRAAGELGNELDVQPLRDPQVEDLRAAATAAETRGDFAGAQKALAQALQISPQDPELLQWQAEMALVKHDWANAQAFATQSCDRGPKLGGLCRRNWTTIRLAAESRGDAAAAGTARQRAAACAVAPPNRF